MCRDSSLSSLVESFLNLHFCCVTPCKPCCVYRNVDRPELCQISLYDFQKFLQMDQKVLSGFSTAQHPDNALFMKIQITALCSLLHPAGLRSPGRRI